MLATHNQEATVMTVFLHGGLVCPTELAALMTSIPFICAAYYWLQCRVVAWWRTKQEGTDVKA